jgi:hypothetical protein
MKPLAQRATGATNMILREAIWGWTIHSEPCLGFFQIGCGSAGFNPLAGSRPLAASDGVFLARFLEVESPFERGKDQPQFRFLNEILITKGEFELGSSIARLGSARANHHVSVPGGRKYERCFYETAPNDRLG